MAKVCILSIDDGDFNKGFAVSLRIKGETDLRSEEDSDEDGTVAGTTGRLRPAPHLTQQYNDWKKRYSSLEANIRGISTASVNAPNRSAYRRESQQAIDKLVQSFRDWLKDSDFRDIENELRTHLQPNEEIQILIQTDNEQLQKLPWENWDFCRHYSKTVVALSPRRYQRPRSFPRPEKLRILAIVGCSKNINTEEDQKLLQTLCPTAEVKFIVEPKLHEFEKLWEERWDILFFAGHSSSKEKEETGYLYINKKEKIEINDLQETLLEAIEKGLKLAIFNSCDGLGLAQYLVKMHIPQVIIWREPVPDRVAQEFLKFFLKEFSQGKSLYMAVQRAKRKLKEATYVEKRFPGVSWLPIIYQNPSAESLKWLPGAPPPPPQPPTPQPLPQKPNGKEWLARIGLNRQKLLLGSGVAIAAILAVLASQLFHSKSLEYRTQQELEKASQELNSLAKSIPLSQQRRNKLNETQTKWESFRDAECELYASLAEKKMTQPDVKSSCLKKITDQRIKDFDYYPPMGNPPEKKGDEKKENEKLKERYKQLKKKLPEQTGLIEKTERSWKIFQFATCEFERIGGGKAAKSNCLIRTAEERIKNLENYFKTTH